MIAIKYFTCIVLLALTSRIYSQDQHIYIFDPGGVSTSFQYTLSQLTQDPVVIADSLDDSIYNYDAAFLFFANITPLSAADVNRLINFTSSGKATYLFSLPGLDSIATTFANHIGIDDIVWFLTSTFVDSITGIDTVFTKGVTIDTSFMNWAGVPMVIGEMDPILHAYSTPLNFNPTYISAVDTLKVIFDLYNLIDDEEFLRRVLEFFKLIPSPPYAEIQFYPETDTAWIYGGCVGPDIIARNLISNGVTDSISIEPGFNSVFFYYDPQGNPINVDKFYFIVTDLFDQYEYELWFHPKSWQPFDPVQIPFDSIFFFYQNDFNIQLVVKLNGSPIDSLSQFFRAEWGLSVDDEDKIPEHFYLSQNYPNPFNPVTSIQYAVSSKQFVTLKVYDILGNEIATLVNEEKQPGIYEVEFNATSHSGEVRNLPSGRQGLASGIYFYQLKAGNYIETKKMVLLR